MERKVFDQLCSIAHREAGIYLKAGKEALVASRVAKRLRVLGLASEQEYLDHLSKDGRGRAGVLSGCHIDEFYELHARA